MRKRFSLVRFLHGRLSCLLDLRARSKPCPTYDEVRQSYVKSDSLLLDRHGEVLHELRMDKDGGGLTGLPSKNISPALKEAVIQAEDKRFYDHPGWITDRWGLRPIKGLTSESLRGASTITMQLASLLDRELQPKKGEDPSGRKGNRS